MTTKAIASRRAAVLGHPIAHSLSPALHNASYAELGLKNWTYDAHDVTTEQLPDFLAQMDDSWAGLSLTMPLKSSIQPHLDVIDPLAEVVGAANTVICQYSGGSRMLIGANTDVYGIVASLRTAGLTTPINSAAALGAGGTAAAALAALAELGCAEPKVLVRSRGRAGALLRAADRMGVHPQWRSFSGPDAIAALLEADVVISTVPAGATDALVPLLTEAREMRAAGATPAGGSAAGAISAGEAAALGMLLDVVYDPWPTGFAEYWRGTGAPIVPGTAMLLHQAGEQVRLMTGKAAPIAAMSQALARAGKPVSAN